LLLSALVRQPGRGQELADPGHGPSSSPEGSHPRALIEPDVKLSPHPAPTF
jgi:hypothetical protein